MHQKASMTSSTISPLPFTTQESTVIPVPVPIPEEDHTVPLPLDINTEITASPLLLSVLDHPSTSVMAIPMEEEDEDSQRCLLDFVEWWCHKVITSSSRDELTSSKEEMVKSLENLGTATPDFGRLCNRIQLAALSLDVGLISEASTSEHWTLLREELILLKSKLLRQDADADVVLLSKQERNQHINATPNLPLEKQAVFQHDYRHVVRLLKVQYHLSVFQNKLLKLVQSANKKDVRQAIDEYEKHITLLFASNSTTTTSMEDDDAVSVASDVTSLPTELAGFLLKDMYRTSRRDSLASSNSTSSSDANTNTNAVHNSSQALAERLLTHVQRILQGKSPYSLQTCRSTLRHLLQQWHEAVLELPMLVQLGYGGTGESAAPSAKKAIAEEDAMLRRLSTCSGASIDGEDDLGSDVEQEADGTVNVNGKRKFIPIQWVDSSSSEDDEQEEQEDQEPTAKRQRQDVLDQDHDHDLTSEHEASESDNDQDNDNDDNITQPSQSQPQPSLEYSREQADAIGRGVQRLGLGRWRLVKHTAKGLLDDFSLPQIRDIHQQLVQEGYLSR